MECVISINDLMVTSKKDLLLDIERLQIKAGSSVAIVGGNGAGKTTLLETLLGLRQIKTGNISWLCKGINLGVQLQNSSYNPDLLVKEIVLLHQHIYQSLDASFYKSLNLESLAKKKYSVLSRGEKQRLDLYVALAHNPQTVLLDEPGTGLDKKYYRAFIKKIEQLNSNSNFTLLMASHTALELGLSSHLLWVENGKIKRFSEKDSLINTLLGAVKVHLKSDDENTIQSLLKQIELQSSVIKIEQISQQEIIVFAQIEFKDFILSKVTQTTLSKFSISETNEDDFLFIVGNQKTSKLN